MTATNQPPSSPAPEIAPGHGREPRFLCTWCFRTRDCPSQVRFVVVVATKRGSLHLRDCFYSYRRALQAGVDVDNASGHLYMLTVFELLGRLRSECEDLFRLVLANRLTLDPLCQRADDGNCRAELGRGLRIGGVSRYEGDENQYDESNNEFFENPCPILNPVPLLVLTPSRRRLP